MSKLPSFFLIAAVCLFSAPPDPKYKIKDGDAPPAEVNQAIRALLTEKSLRIETASAQLYLEFWFVKAPPAESASPAESGATLALPHGTLLGVVRVDKNVNDRRGDRIAAGLYQLRLSFHPVDGAHQGISPQRDFLILTKLSPDSDASAKPSFADLMQQAKQASGSSHPFSFSCWKQDQEFSPGLRVEGEADTALHVRIGSLPVVVVIAGAHVG